MMLGEVYIEFQPNGNFVKVSAICANTGFEVSIVGDARVGQKQLKQLAVSKLKMTMEKAKKEKKAHGPNRGLMV